ncbi:hypothetical protein WJX73_003633 [Symbiochloris irregularis]|uniref:Uncharacterized protein n=1 Tax=Symbiochloris irregularis TaxID=706552 RepID=A0AAW1NXI8_9CHLO
MVVPFEQLEPLDLGNVNGPDSKWTEPVPLGPPDLRHGTLKNGFQYYVRSNPKPKARVALSLVVRAGSVLEDSTEQGLAHFVEHLAFSATENFSEHRIVHYLESIGAAFGADSNAQTSFDDTRYFLQVPSDGFNTALDLLSEFASKIRCSAADVEKERGAILDELRAMHNSTGRAVDQLFKLCMQGSQYANRMPKGLEKIVKTAPASKLKGFFQRWYRPEHMALVVVGDLRDPEAAVRRIRDTFEPWTGHESAPVPMPSFGIVPHSQPRFLVTVDRESQSSLVQVNFTFPQPSLSRPCDYLQEFRQQAFDSAMQRRFFIMSQQEDPPFHMAVSGCAPICAAACSRAVTASVSENRGSIAHALEAILTELARARMHGFHQQEVNKACADFLAGFEQTWLEREQQQSEVLREEYERNFLSGEFVTGREYESRLAKTILPMITCEDLRAVAHECSMDRSCTVQATCHSGVASEDTLRKVVAKVQALERRGEIGEWEQVDDLDSLLPEDYEPQPGEITSVKKWPKMGATELLLSNGMRVTFKSTTFLDDQIMMHGWARGGLTEVPREHFSSCCLAPGLAEEFGYLGKKPTDLANLLAGKRAELNVGEAQFSRALSGEQSPKDLETALVMVHLLFTQSVRTEPGQLRSFLRRFEQKSTAQQRDPGFRFRQEVVATNYGNCYYYQPSNRNDVKSVDAELACRHFNRAFSNPAEFRLIFTGNIQEEDFLRLTQDWLASIPRVPEPADVAPDSITSLDYEFPRSVVRKTVRAQMVEAACTALITFPVAVDTTRPSQRMQQSCWLGFVTHLLRTKLTERMRFEAGKVYTVSVTVNFGHEPAHVRRQQRHGELSITFGCDPDAVDVLTEMALAEVQRLQEEGPLQEELDTLLTLEQLEHEASQEENAYWHNQMFSLYGGAAFAELQDLDASYQLLMDARAHVRKACTPEALQDAFQTLLPYPCRSRYTALSLVPAQPFFLSVLPTTPRKAGIWAGAAVLLGLGLMRLLHLRGRLAGSR